jgi:hypothetical protein
MTRFIRAFLGLLLTTPLLGCALFSVADVAVLALGAPWPDQKRSVKLSGYSLKPNSEQNAAELLLAAVPPEEGNVYFTGRVEWTGLSTIKQSVLSVDQSMAAITDFNILFLWWSEAHERYEVLIRLPIKDIYSVELWTPGLATNIRLCYEKDEITLGDEALTIDRKTTLRVVKPSGFIDADKTKEVFSLLDSQLFAKPQPQDLPGPCDEVSVNSEELPLGFNG